MLTVTFLYGFGMRMLWCTRWRLPQWLNSLREDKAASSWGKDLWSPPGKDLLRCEGICLLMPRNRQAKGRHPREERRKNPEVLRYIQELPGHKHSKTTEIYTHVSAKNLSKIKSPFDLMGGEKHSEWVYTQCRYNPKLEWYTQCVYKRVIGNRQYKRRWEWWKNIKS